MLCSRAAPSCLHVCCTEKLMTTSLQFEHKMHSQTHMCCAPGLMPSCLQFERNTQSQMCMCCTQELVMTCLHAANWESSRQSAVGAFQDASVHSICSVIYSICSQHCKMLRPSATQVLLLIALSCLSFLGLHRSFQDVRESLRVFAERSK